MTKPRARRPRQKIPGAPLSPHLNVVGKIVDYESGQLDEEGTRELFQHLVNTGMVHHLQGHYGRTAQAMLQEGFIQPPKTRKSRMSADDIQKVMSVISALGAPPLRDTARWKHGPVRKLGRLWQVQDVTDLEAVHTRARRAKDRRLTRRPGRVKSDPLLDDILKARARAGT